MSILVEETFNVAFRSTFADQLCGGFLPIFFTKYPSMSSIRSSSIAPAATIRSYS